ncbi:MAG TPA: MMPL family transporter [bacterium]|nr:MMPL family transporter [bacterium]
MKRLMVEFSLRHPKWVVALSLLVTVALGLQIPRIVIDTDPENMLPADESARVFHDEVTETFGLYDYVVVGIVREGGVFRPETLARVATLTEAIHDIDGVIVDDILAPGDVDDISTTSDGILRVSTLMEEAPETEEGAQRILAQIRVNPVLAGKLASDDGEAMALFVPVESKDVANEVAQEIQAVIDGLGGDEDWHLAGIPLAEDTFGGEMFKQMAVSAPAAFLVIFLLMLYFFRKPAIVLAPMIVAMMSVIWTMGLLIGLGFTVHIMSSMIPIFLIPIAVLNSIHMLTEFHERYQLHRDMGRTVRDTMDELWLPMIFTSLTTVVGFSSLMLTPIPPVQVFGGFVAFGIAVAWLLSITFNPAYAMLLSPKTLEGFGRTEESHRILRTAMHGVRDFSLRFRGPVLVAGATVFGLSLWGLTKVVVNDNPVKWFKPGHPMRVADEVMNRHLAGTYLSYLAVESPDPDGIKEPEAMRYVEALQQHLLAQDNVGATTSIADIVKKVGSELRNDPAAAVVPDSREEIAQYIFLYEMSGGNPEDLFRFVTPEADRANIWVQMRQGENREVLAVVESLRDWLARNPPPAGLRVDWAGLPYINVVWQQKMVAGMGKALAGSFATVLVMMMLLFRSVRLGVLSMIPLTSTIVLVYGAIGFLGKPYDMPIAVLSSLTLGLSIDFAIHFLQRTRELYRQTGDFRKAMEGLFEAPSHAIARNILVISIGFVPMFFASLVPYVTVSAFFFAIMLVSGGTTLVSLPAILSYLNPAFLAGSGRHGAVSASRSAA